MTPWEFHVAMDGWISANRVSNEHDKSYPTDEEFEDAIRRLH